MNDRALPLLGWKGAICPAIGRAGDAGRNLLVIRLTFSLMGRPKAHQRYSARLYLSCHGTVAAFIVMAEEAPQVSPDRGRWIGGPPPCVRMDMGSLRRIEIWPVRHPPNNAADLQDNTLLFNAINDPMPRAQSCRQRRPGNITPMGKRFCKMQMRNPLRPIKIGNCAREAKCAVITACGQAKPFGCIAKQPFSASVQHADL